MITIQSNLVAQFNELASLTSDDFYRSRSYKNAAFIISEMPSDEFISRTDFMDIYGIGNGINNKILEFKETGVIAKLQTLRAESADNLNSDMYKVRDGFITKKLSHNDAVELVNSIYDIIGYSDKFLVAGSFRRNKSYVGDIDMMVPARSYARICHQLDAAGFKVVSHGDYKSQYLIDEVNNVPMDVISYTSKDKIFQLLYLTGSKDTNIRMRRMAARKGYLLNQYGLYDRESGDEVLRRVTSEEQVFHALDMEYIDPVNR